MLDVGSKSGCLTIISNDFQSNYNLILKDLLPLVEQCWGEVKSDTDMPDDFIEYYLQYSFWYFFRLFPYFLYHKKGPNTSYNLQRDLLNHKLYKVQCDICHKTYFIDEFSFLCIKWQYCNGAECLSTTIIDDECSYENLCIVNNDIFLQNVIKYANYNSKLNVLNTISNPYFSLTDGLYKTSISDYLKFCDCIGEFIGDGTLLYQRCQNNKASMCVIKRQGYYGFFIINLNNSSSGISIVNGGMTKRVTKQVDFQWLFDSFSIILFKYLQILTPFRLIQDQISEELKFLGFTGSIHGCIIDIDFYHHIMLNPIDGSMTFYYSSEFGRVKLLSSFKAVIKSLQEHEHDNSISTRDYELLCRTFDMKNQDYLLGGANNSYLVDLKSDIIFGDEQMISRSTGMYGVSRKISPLQRLFSGCVLRSFDLSLLDNV